MGRVLDWISWANYRVFKWSTKRWKRLVKRRVMELEHELDIPGHEPTCTECNLKLLPKPTLTNTQLVMKYRGIRSRNSSPADVIQAMGDSFSGSIRAALGGYEKPSPPPVEPKPRHYRLDR